MQPDVALHQTELPMPNLWSAIIVFSNISLVKKMYCRLEFGNEIYCKN